MKINHQENEEQTNQDEVSQGQENEESTSKSETSTVFGMHKGFGFIKYPPNNLFFHYKSAEDFESLQRGDKVQFVVSEDAKGKPVAIQVKRV